MMINTDSYKTIRALGCRNPLSHARLTRLSGKTWYMDTSTHDDGFMCMGVFKGIISLEKEGVWPLYGHIFYQDDVFFKGGVARLASSPDQIVPHGPDGIFRLEDLEMRGQWQMGFLVKIDGFRGSQEKKARLLGWVHWLYQRSDEEKNRDPLWPFHFDQGGRQFVDLGVALKDLEVEKDTWDAVFGKSSAPNTPARRPIMDLDKRDKKKRKR